MKFEILGTDKAVQTDQSFPAVPGPMGFGTEGNKGNKDMVSLFPLRYLRWLLLKFRSLHPLD